MGEAAGEDAGLTRGRLHRHDGDFALWTVLLDGEAQGDVWFASVAGLIQYGDGAVRKGRVAIVRREECDGTLWGDA